MERPPGNLSSPPRPRGIEDAVLSELRQQFPQFHIWREANGQRVRYIARRLSLGTSLHTVVTADLDELRATLASGGAGQDPGLHDTGASAALSRQRRSA
jgi:hypothetical protein